MIAHSLIMRALYVMAGWRGRITKPIFLGIPMASILNEGLLF
jgi:hypothetical protein